MSDDEPSKNTIPVDYWVCKRCRWMMTNVAYQAMKFTPHCLRCDPENRKKNTALSPVYRNTVESLAELTRRAYAPKNERKKPPTALRKLEAALRDLLSSVDAVDEGVVDPYSIKDARKALEGKDD